MLVLVFTYIHTLCMRAAKAVTSLRICAGSSELSTLDSAISFVKHIYLAGIFIWLYWW